MFREAKYIEVIVVSETPVLSHGHHFPPPTVLL